MNILIPDSWLREYLKTNATPVDIQRCLSLCGPSIERTQEVNGDVVYDVEITTNRVDSFSVYGIAREAAAILPEFGFNARLLPMDFTYTPGKKIKPLGVSISDTHHYCRRILAIKLNNIHLTASPEWMQKKLEKVGQRALNNIIDITNYVMWETGHPCHAFDYDRLKEKKIIVREAVKGERMRTLDNKQYTLRGGELVFDDGTGEIIDFPGIMGTMNTVVTDMTKNVLLFVENSDPVHIRYGSMGLGIRTQAATINEKGPDPELAKIAILRAAKLACDITGASIDSPLFDLYPKKNNARLVCVSHEKLSSYLGADIPSQRVISILHNLGFLAKSTTKNKQISYNVTAPSWRSDDIAIPEDIIEEVARIYGYHNITAKLPASEPPVVTPDPTLTWEEEIKIRLRDWGFTELYTYSMISAAQMDEFGLDKQKAYKIANPLSKDWVYMRPSLEPGFVYAIKENLKHHPDFRVFELSKIYRFEDGSLPVEEDTLIIGLTGNRFFEVKGVGEAILALFGIPAALDEYGSIRISEDLCILTLSVTKLTRDAKPAKTYVPIPKYPPVVEDLSFLVPDKFAVGPFLTAIKLAHPLVSGVSLLDVYENTRTIHITYQDPEKNLTNEEIIPIREILIQLAKNKFNATLKTTA